MATAHPTPHLAIALDGAGWHPAAWREPHARPTELFTAGYWLDLITEAEHGLIDLVTIEDAMRLQSDNPSRPDNRTDRVRGRLDAQLIAARVAPLTHHIGLVPTAVVTHTEPFHTAKAVASLDHISTGRAGIRIQISPRPHEATHFGRRTFPETNHATTEHFDEAADYIEVLRRLWDSWEDDAEIRDTTTGRFIDRDKLHYIDFTGRWFDVKGPSITPRPPQGQPVVAALGHHTTPYQLIAHTCDLGFVTPTDTADATTIVNQIHAAQGNRDLHLFGDIVVFLDENPATATARRHRLDDTAGTEYTSDAHIFAGTETELADLLLDWHTAGLSGFRLRPATLPYDLTRITRHLVPELQRRTAYRDHYEATTLRGLLGLPRPTNRYTTT